jgi:translation initiation factor 1
MVGICPKCGLPLDICACKSIQKTGESIKVYSTKKKFNKFVTVVEGLSGEELKNTAKSLKHKLACGGTVKDGLIILQGDQKKKTIEALVSLGFSMDNIKST